MNDSQLPSPQWLERGRLLTLEETAEILSVSKPTLYRILGTNELPWVRVGSNRRIDPQDLQQYIKNQKRFGSPESEPNEDTA